MVSKDSKNGRGQHTGKAEGQMVGEMVLPKEYNTPQSLERFVDKVNILYVL